MASNGRITLALIGQKLDILADTVNRIDSTVNGDEDKPGLKGRVANLEHTDATRTWHIRALWGAALAYLVQIFK